MFEFQCDVIVEASVHRPFFINSIRKIEVSTECDSLTILRANNDSEGSSKMPNMCKLTQLIR